MPQAQGLDGHYLSCHACQRTPRILYLRYRNRMGPLDICIHGNQSKQNIIKLLCVLRTEPGDRRLIYSDLNKRIIPSWKIHITEQPRVSLVDDMEAITSVGWCALEQHTGNNVPRSRRHAEL